MARVISCPTKATTPTGKSTCEDGCNGVCPKESARYFIPCKRDGEVFYRECRFGKMRRLKKILPAKYAPMTFGDYNLTSDNKRAVGLAKKVCSDKRGNLYLYGAPGTGKTFLASLVAKEFTLANRRVVFRDLPALLDDLKATFDNGTTQDLINAYCTSDLLVLDDLGAGQLSDWSVGIIYRLINERYNSERPLLVTCNFDLEGLEKKLGSVDTFSASRIVSRLEEMCWLGFLGDNDRRRK